MTDKAIAQVSHSQPAYDTGSLLLGTTLTVAALILVPAMASRMGLGAALTGAMRMALMRASSRAVNNGKGEECGDGGAGFSCH